MLTKKKYKRFIQNMRAISRCLSDSRYGREENEESSEENMCREKKGYFAKRCEDLEAILRKSNQIN